MSYTKKKITKLIKCSFKVLLLCSLKCGQCHVVASRLNSELYPLPLAWLQINFRKLELWEILKIKWSNTLFSLQTSMQRPQGIDVFPKIDSKCRVTQDWKAGGHTHRLVPVITPLSFRVCMSLVVKLEPWTSNVLGQRVMVTRRLGCWIAHVHATSSASEQPSTRGSTFLSLIFLNCKMVIIITHPLLGYSEDVKIQ